MSREKEIIQETKYLDILNLQSTNAILTAEGYKEGVSNVGGIYLSDTEICELRNQVLGESRDNTSYTLTNLVTRFLETLERFSIYDEDLRKTTSGKFICKVGDNKAKCVVKAIFSDCSFSILGEDFVINLDNEWIVFLASNFPPILVCKYVEEAKKEIMKRAQRGLLTREELKNIEVPILREMNK